MPDMPRGRKQVEYDGVGVDPADLTGHQILDYIVDPTLPSAQFHLSNGVVIKLDLQSHGGGPVTSALDHALSQRLKAHPDLPSRLSTPR